MRVAKRGRSKPALRPECVQDLVKDQAENDQEDGQDVALEIPKKERPEPVKRRVGVLARAVRVGRADHRRRTRRRRTDAKVLHDLRRSELCAGLRGGSKRQVSDLMISEGRDFKE